MSSAVLFRSISLIFVTMYGSERLVSHLYILITTTLGVCAWLCLQSLHSVILLASKMKIFVLLGCMQDHCFPILQRALIFANSLSLYSVLHCPVQFSVLTRRLPLTSSPSSIGKSRFRRREKKTPTQLQWSLSSLWRLCKMTHDKASLGLQ